MRSRVSPDTHVTLLLASFQEDVLSSFLKMQSASTKPKASIILNGGRQVLVSRAPPGTVLVTAGGTRGPVPVSVAGGGVGTLPVTSTSGRGQWQQPQNTIVKKLLLKAFLKSNKKKSGKCSPSRMSVPRSSPVKNLKK